MSQVETGQRIAALRKEKGYTQKQLAELLHVTDKAVSKWERGDSYPETGMLVPLAAALGVSVDTLLGAPPPPAGPGGAPQAKRTRFAEGLPRAAAGYLAAAAAWTLAAVPPCAAGWLAGMFGPLPLLLCLPAWLAALAVVLACRSLPEHARRACRSALALAGALLALGVAGGRFVSPVMPAYSVAVIESLVLLAAPRLWEKPGAAYCRWQWKSVAGLSVVPGWIVLGIAVEAVRYGGWQRGISVYVLRMEPWWPLLGAGLALCWTVWLALRTGRGKMARLALVLPGFVPLMQWCLGASARSVEVGALVSLTAAALLPGLARAACLFDKKEHLQNSTDMV